MKIIYIFILALFAISSLESQTLIIKKRSGEVNEIDIEKIESLRMKPPVKEAEIGGPLSVDFGIADCSKPVIEKTITIFNTGGKDLFVTHSEFSTQGSYRLSNGGPLMCSIKPGESYSFKVIFEPTVPGDHHSDLIITSNASSGLKYKIELTGKYIEQIFKLNSTSFNLGDICPLSVKETEILLKNEGNSDCKIKVQSDVIDMVNDELTIPAGAEIKFIAIARTSVQNGEYSGQLTFTGPCNNKIIAEIIWKVRGPEVECKSIVDLSAKPGDTASTIIQIENKSVGEDFLWTEATFSNNQFELEKVNLPMIIKTGSSVSVKLNYIPSTVNQISGFLTLSGTPCDIEIKIPIKGSPGNIEMIFADGFENSETGEFPYSTGWVLKNYGVTDSIPYVTKEMASAGEKSLYAWGNFGTSQQTSNYIRIPIKNIPQVIFAECDVMINQIGFCGIGLMKIPDGSFPVIPLNVEFGNHGHFYYVFGNEEKRWQNDVYAPKKWYRITLRYDKLNKRATIWIDGEQVVDEVAPNNPDNSYEEFYLSSGGGYPGGGTAFFDNVKIWTNKQ